MKCLAVIAPPRFACVRYQLINMRMNRYFKVKQILIPKENICFFLIPALTKSQNDRKLCLYLQHRWLVGKKSKSMFGDLFMLFKYRFFLIKPLWDVTFRFVLYQLSKNLNRSFFMDFLMDLRWQFLKTFQILCLPVEDMLLILWWWMTRTQTQVLGLQIEL